MRGVHALGNAFPANLGSWGNVTAFKRPSAPNGYLLPQRMATPVIKPKNESFLWTQSIIAPRKDYRLQPVAYLLPPAFTGSPSLKYIHQTSPLSLSLSLCSPLASLRGEKRNRPVPPPPFPRASPALFDDRSLDRGYPSDSRVSDLRSEVFGQVWVAMGEGSGAPDVSGCVFLLGFSDFGTIASDCGNAVILKFLGFFWADLRGFWSF